MPDFTAPQEVPAKYTNFFRVIVTPQTVRIAFGEAFGAPESANFHTAIVLLPSDAKTLANLLLKLMADNEARMAATEAGDTADFTASSTSEKDARP